MSVPTELAVAPAPIRAPDDTVTAPVVPVPINTAPDWTVEELAIDPVTLNVPDETAVLPE